MFNIQFKIKEGSNSLPRSSSTNSRHRRNSAGSYTTNSLRSSLSSRSPYNSLRRKDKKVRIVTTRERDRDHDNIVNGKILEDDASYLDCIILSPLQ